MPPTNEVTLDVAGARVIIPAATLTQLWLARLKGGEPLNGLPKIGARFHEGTYAGIVRGGGCAPDYHLIVLDGDRENMAWKDAKAWAEGLGGTLPLRKEQAVLFGNVPELFEKAWYWSCEEHASDPEFAWCQHFVLGYQDYYHELCEFRARAVRKIPI